MVGAHEMARRVEDIPLERVIPDPGNPRRSFDDDALAEIALRSRGTPRIANRLLRRVRDWAQVHGTGQVDVNAAQAALALFDVDEAGLDRLDRAVLDALCRRFGGGPVGLSTLAVAVGEETDTVETVAEPYLVRQGYIVRSPRGRIATPAATFSLESLAAYWQVPQARPHDAEDDVRVLVEVFRHALAAAQEQDAALPIRDPYARIPLRRKIRHRYRRARWKLRRRLRTARG